MLGSCSCRIILEKKNAALTVILQQDTQQTVERYRQKWKQLFQEKRHRLEEA